MAARRNRQRENSGSGSEDERPDPIPDAVDHFLGRLLKGMQVRDVAEIHTLYEVEFNKLSQENYKHTRWPKAESVKIAVSDEPLFLILYKELYYRHVYDRMTNQITFEDRQGSWENYCRLLDLILFEFEEGDVLSLILPVQWIWDILDEFVYHYQVFCTWRGKQVKMTEWKTIQQLKDNPQVYETKAVLVYLHKVARLSKIEDYLLRKEGRAASCETTRLLGYFAQMQLLRMHSLLGDYHLAMQTVSKIDLHEEVPLFYKNIACHVSLYYYMGFAYLMMRRYTDSIRTFSDILVFLSKASGFNSKSYQFDAIVKKREQMYSLLLIALALCPCTIDESLEKALRDKPDCAEKQAKLQRGDELCFMELFNYANPKFVPAAPPDYDNLDNFKMQEATERQQQLFMKEMRQQQRLPRIGSYMKLYTAIKTSKLAALCDMTESDLEDQLMSIMHKTMQKVRHGKGAPLDGEEQLSSEVEFYVEGNMVHINVQRTERAHTEVFLEHILKYQDLMKKMQKPGQKSLPP